MINFTKFSLSLVTITVLISNSVLKAQEAPLPPVIPGGAIEPVKEDPKGTPYFIAGIRGGGIYSTLQGIDSTDFVNGISAGAFMAFSNGSNWSTSVDLLYSQKGAKYSKTTHQDTTIRFKNEYDLNFNYIEIPVLFRYNFMPDSSRFRFNVFAGPSLHIRQKTNALITITPDSVASGKTGEIIEKDEDLTFRYIPLDYGVTAGAGITFNVNDFLALSIDLRANYGLLDLREYVSKSSKKVNNLNAAVMIGAAYRFKQK